MLPGLYSEEAIRMTVSGLIKSNKFRFILIFLLLADCKIKLNTL
jgi:hypothetical protein